MKVLVCVMLLMLSAPAYAQDSITIREASKEKFVATLLSQDALATDEAQRRVLMAATETCKGSNPVLGHYKFKSSRSISPSPTPSNNLFQFDQEFTCVVGMAETPGPAVPTVISDSEKERLVELVTDETRKFLGSANAGELAAFRSKFSDELSGMLLAKQWTEQQASLHSKSGAMEKDPQFKVTAYVDPPNSPGPGIYLAVDFQVSYERAPFRCGYVMWLFDQRSNLSVFRVEDGIIYDEEAATMTAAQIAQTKADFRCFVP